VAAPDIREKLVAQGAVPQSSTPAELAEADRQRPGALWPYHPGEGPDGRVITHSQFEKKGQDGIRRMAEGQNRTMQVLLVDDQAVTIQVFAASVRKTFSGAKVHTAVDLPEALQIASGHPLDLVLLDLALPTCQGIDALQRFRSAFPAVPVLVVSANEDQERIKECLEAGARGYITKTTAVVGLPAAMKTVVEGGRYVPAHTLGGDLH
jgi:CheY-like chemotaxis protein